MPNPNPYPWVKRIEQEYGQPIEQILQQAADAAPVTGYTMADLGREWGVPRSSLLYYCQKIGVRFPRGCSPRQKEAVAEGARRNGIARCRYWITVDGERRTLKSECRRVGRDYHTVRYLMRKYNISAEEAIRRPSMPLCDRRRGAA